MEFLEELSISRGYFLRREAVALGVDDRRLTRGVRRGWWVRMRQGAYCHTERWRAMTAVERHLARGQASLDLAEGNAALSHLTACAHWGAPLWNAPLDLVHLVRCDNGGSRIEAGVRHHVGAIEPHEVLHHRGHGVTDPTRSMIDGLGLLDVESGMVLGDWMLHHKLTDAGRCWDLKTRHNQWPHSRVLEVVLRLLDGRAQSVGESRLRYLCWWLGLPMPDVQHTIMDGPRFVADTDVAWPDLGIYGEFDGKVKYGRLLKPGQQPGDVVFAEKKREDDIRRVTGGTLVRWTWNDLTPRSGPTQQLIGLLRHSA